MKIHTDKQTYSHYNKDKHFIFISCFRHYFNVDFAKFKMPGLREKEGAGQVKYIIYMVIHKTLPKSGL